ncbi:MAG: metallopeptidase family protein [Candidatus Aminicenantes bacterium]|nr:metallopeptidase family protein [Candidatus Aminicenantes bacterium]
MKREKRSALERRRFETLVEEALQSLPRRFKKHLQNIVVIVEDSPPKERSLRSGTLLGLYHGLPYPQRGATFGSAIPDVIVIYQKSIERFSRNESDIRRRVREVVLHEVGHYFGLSEDDLRDIENEEA